MSMRTYAYEDYGLVLNEEMIKMICEKVFADEPHGEEDDGYALYSTDICQLAGNFTGELFPLSDNGVDGWDNSEFFDSDTVYYVPMKKYPQLFGTAYNNMNEVVEEFKERLGEYLPEDFNYRSHIKHIVGTTWG